MQRRFYANWDLAPVLLTTEQAGLLLQLTPERVTRLCANGTLPACKVGKSWRIDRDRLREWWEVNKRA